jgi:small nuclear ribonucleoprotein (snRNP)-like protein
MRSRDRLIRKSLRSRFVVTLRSGATFEGLLVEADEMTAVLVDAFAVDSSSRAKVDGSLYLPRAEVDYMQKPEKSA